MRRHARRRAGLAALAAGTAAAALAACAGGTPAPATRSPAPAPASRGAVTSPPAAATADWPTYHANPQRTGAVSGLPPAGPLRIAWARDLGAAVYAQPLVIGSTVIAATESNQITGLSRATGRQLWSVRIGPGSPVPLHDQPCGNIDPLGITGTPVYDSSTGLVYAVAEVSGGAKILAAVDAATGKLAFTRSIPAPDGQPAYDQQRGALALADGRVYVTFGGHFGDCGPYRGSVVAVPASGSGPLLSYVVPTRAQAGIWAPGGPVIAPDGGTIYVASGNGAATRPPFDGSDSVIALTPGLRRTGVFAPAAWPLDNADDLDLGSMSPALFGDSRILQIGKRGTGYLLNARQLGGVGGEIASAPLCPAFGAAAVTGTTAFVGCYPGGTVAVSVAGDRVRLLWRGPATASGSPAAGGGVIWTADWNAGVLYALSPATGQVRERIGLGSALPHFASPALSGGLVLVGTLHGVVAVSGA